MCLLCRRRLDEGEPCDDSASHRVVSLATDEGRRALAQEVFGPRPPKVMRVLAKRPWAANIPGWTLPFLIPGAFVLPALGVVALPEAQAKSPMAVVVFVAILAAYFTAIGFVTRLLA